MIQVGAHAILLLSSCVDAGADSNTRLAGLRLQP